MFCGPETVDVEGPQNILLSRGLSPISILLYTECPKEKKSTTNQSNMCKKDYLLPDMAT